MSSADILPPPSKTRYLTVPDTAAKKDSLKQFSVDEVKQVSARTFPAFRKRISRATRLAPRGTSASRRRSYSDEMRNGPGIWLGTLASQSGHKGSEARRYRNPAINGGRGSSSLAPASGNCMIMETLHSQERYNSAYFTRRYLRCGPATLTCTAHSPPT